MTGRRVHLILLFMITFTTFVVYNGAIDANIMEARNLTTAREMIEKGNWFDPTMNGELRLEKPPLPTWIAAGMLYFFGGEDLSLLRLPAGVAAVLLIFFLYKLTSEFSEDHLLPFLVSGTAATSFYIFFLARDISWDIFCHSFMIGAIWLIHKGMNSNLKGWACFVPAGVLMGLSFMSKGPVSFYALLLPYLIACTFTYGWKGSGHKKWPLLAMVLVMLAISMPWPLYLRSAHPGLSEAIARQESSAWLNRSIRPFYHYWSFPVQSGIWTLLATIPFICPYGRPRIDRYGNYRFLMIWIVAAVVLLSLFPEKKERYLLPVLLPLAMLTGTYIRYLIESVRESTAHKADIQIIRFNTLLMALICLVIPPLLFFPPFRGAIPDPGHLILIFSLFYGLATLLFFSFLKNNPFWMWAGMVGMVLAVCISLMPLAPALAVSNPGYRSYYELRKRADLKGVPFYFNGEIPGKFIEVVWNCGREIKGWDPSVQQQFPEAPPLVFLSNQPPSEVLPAQILNGHRIELIGHFDGNPGKKGGNSVLSNYVAIIR